jgi:hypothetical protein
LEKGNPAKKGFGIWGIVLRRIVPAGWVCFGVASSCLLAMTCRIRLVLLFYFSSASPRNDGAPIGVLGLAVVLPIVALGLAVSPLWAFWCAPSLRGGRKLSRMCKRVAPKQSVGGRELYLERSR